MVACAIRVMRWSMGADADGLRGAPRRILHDKNTGSDTHCSRRSFGNGFCRLLEHARSGQLDHSASSAPAGARRAAPARARQWCRRAAVPRAQQSPRQQRRPAGSGVGVDATGSEQHRGREGCGKPHGPYTDPGAAAGTVVTGYDELATSSNHQTTHGNSIYNSDPSYFTQAQYYYYDKSLNLINNDSFITCTVTSKTPLTIKYTINADAKWSDGVPVTADDLLLPWIAQSGKFNTGEVKTGRRRQPAAEQRQPGRVRLRRARAWHWSRTFPTISADGKSMTVGTDQAVRRLPAATSPPACPGARRSARRPSESPIRPRPSRPWSRPRPRPRTTASPGQDRQLLEHRLRLHARCPATSRCTCPTAPTC